MQQWKYAKIETGYLETKYQLNWCPFDECTVISVVDEINIYCS